MADPKQPPRGSKNLNQPTKKPAGSIEYSTAKDKKPVSGKITIRPGQSPGPSNLVGKKSGINASKPNTNPKVFPYSPSASLTSEMSLEFEVDESYSESEIYNEDSSIIEDESSDTYSDSYTQRSESNRSTIRVLRHSSKTGHDYEQFNFLDPLPFYPLSKENEFTYFESLKAYGEDCKTCLFCIGLGPKLCNPCFCASYSVVTGSRKAAFFSGLVNAFSFIIEFCRLFRVTHSTDVALSAVHLTFTLVMIPLCFQLYFAVRKYELRKCIPWAVGQIVMFLLYFAFYIIHLMELAGGNRDEFPKRFYIPELCILVTTIGFIINAYIFWVIVAYIVCLYKGKIGSNVEDPFRLDPDNFLHHSVFDKEDISIIFESLYTNKKNSTSNSSVTSTTIISAAPILK